MSCFVLVNSSTSFDGNASLTSHQKWQRWRVAVPKRQFDKVKEWRTKTPTAISPNSHCEFSGRRFYRADKIQKVSPQFPLLSYFVPLKTNRAIVTVPLISRQLIFPRDNVLLIDSIERSIRIVLMCLRNSNSWRWRRNSCAHDTVRDTIQLIRNLLHPRSHGQRQHVNDDEAFFYYLYEDPINRADHTQKMRELVSNFLNSLTSRMKRIQLSTASIYFLFTNLFRQ